MGELPEAEGGEASDFRLGFERNPFERDGTIPSVLDEQTGQLNTRLQFGRYSPVTIGSEIDTVPWETWTYIQLNGGIEFTFTDEWGNGRYDFAPLPEATTEDAEAITYMLHDRTHASSHLQQAV